MRWSRTRRSSPRRLRGCPSRIPIRRRSAPNRPARRPTAVSNPCRQTRTPERAPACLSLPCPGPAGAAKLGRPPRGPAALLRGPWRGFRAGHAAGLDIPFHVERFERFVAAVLRRGAENVGDHLVGCGVARFPHAAVRSRLDFLAGGRLLGNHVFLAELEDRFLRLLFLGLARLDRRQDGGLVRVLDAGIRLDFSQVNLAGLAGAPSASTVVPPASFFLYVSISAGRNL